MLLLAGLAKDGSVVFVAPQQGNCIDTEIFITDTYILIESNHQELTVLICAGGKSLLLGLLLNSWAARIRAHVLFCS